MKIMQAVGESILHICGVMGAKLEKNASLENGVYGSSIPLYIEDDKGVMCEYQFYLYFKNELLNIVAEQLLQSNFNQSDLADISRELANQIIGYAKMLLTDANNVKTKLGTPEFLGVVESFPIKFDKKELYKINNETLQIGYKKI